MSLTSPLFFAFLAAVVAAFHVSESVAYRRLVLGAANAIFIASYLTDFTQVVPLLAFLMLGYVCVSTVYFRKSAPVQALGVIAILCSYVFLKRYSFFEGLGQLPFPYLTIGLSYVLFRILHLMMDVRSGDPVERIGPLAFFRFTCNFLCFVSGPIQRYQDFRAADGKATVQLDSSRVYQAFSRIATGYVKFVVVAASAEYAFTFLNPKLQATGLAFPTLCVIYATVAALYTIYLYFNFSGYMDIVIGVGTLLGQSLPENFDKPFLARSFLEFWQRWHMTLSQWFKFYLFNPLLMFLMTCFPAPALTAYLGVLAFFVTFSRHGRVARHHGGVHHLRSPDGRRRKHQQALATGLHRTPGQKALSRAQRTDGLYLFCPRSDRRLLCAGPDLPLGNGAASIHPACDAARADRHSGHVRLAGGSFRCCGLDAGFHHGARAKPAISVSHPRWRDRQESGARQQDDGDLCGRNTAAQSSRLRVQGVLN
ncbi:MBOAT family O-acyltransferase [Bradyrhizobium sp. AZCC 2289]|uniref:MBOAT family O-acyltransferase n=1 Tax=Bradyrhizobium sp. AZCC 2289 TaxID=3117026 RepID=UPI002FEFE54E